MPDAVGRNHARSAGCAARVAQPAVELDVGAFGTVRVAMLVMIDPVYQNARRSPIVAVDLPSARRAALRAGLSRGLRQRGQECPPREDGDHPTHGFQASIAILEPAARDGEVTNDAMKLATGSRSRDRLARRARGTRGARGGASTARRPAGDPIALPGSARTDVARTEVARGRSGTGRRSAQ
jgi:hypothetical protein